MNMFNPKHVGQEWAQMPVDKPYCIRCKRNENIENNIDNNIERAANTISIYGILFFKIWYMYASNKKENETEMNA